MTIFNVATAAELSSAIAGAAGGDRIVVADGNYGKLSIFNRSFDSTVTIVAANPGAGAHFDGLTITGSKNVSLVGLDLGRALNAGEAYYTQLNAISGSTNISLDRVTIHGSQDGDPTNDGMGLMLRNNAGFSITNSTFTDLHRGIVAQSSTNTTIQDNSITRIQSDGIISIANDGLSIQGNHLGDFRPVLGDHADAMQFWNTGQTKGQSNITIKDNVIFQTYFSGVEGTGIQGIFISDPLSYGYQNILIQNNAIYANDAYHGIFVNGATGVQILDNTVTSNPNDGKMFWIFATNSSDVAIQNNVTDRITAVNVTNLFQDGNLDFQVNPAARADLPSLASPSDAHDLITAGAGYQLPAEAPAATADANRLYGGDGDDVLDGGSGFDILDGGAGVDRTSGGLGDDWHIVDNASDMVVEGVGQGYDRVLTNVSYRLPVGTEIELMVATGTDAVRLTGNEFSQYLAGNAADNVLDGGGGADTTAGGAGNDWHLVDSSSDSVIEHAGQGYDRVIASSSFRLTADADVELLLTSAPAGTQAIDLAGSDTVNTVYGNEGANHLYGMGGDDALSGFGGNDVLDGGTGADTMFGGTGDDWYIVDNARDQVIEGADAGYDRILTSIDYTLGTDRHVELLMTSSPASTTALNLAGNDLSNSIFGNEGANLLQGNGGDDWLVGNGGADTLMGGLGRDKLTGGEGNDIFVFGSGDGQDLITDFNGGGAGDIIQLTGLGLSSFADVQANASQLGADTVIQLGSGQTLTLQHFNLASLSAYDFQFG